MNDFAQGNGEWTLNPVLHDATSVVCCILIHIIFKGSFGLNLEKAIVS